MEMCRVVSFRTNSRAAAELAAGAQLFVGALIPQPLSPFIVSSLGQVR